jgi:NAD(P)-dependent dehydrogenase (short-subunit alcohol dehydrogenase family)
MGTEQKVAVITGASQGIGAALVKAYRDRKLPGGRDGAVRQAVE